MATFCTFSTIKKEYFMKSQDLFRRITITFASIMLTAGMTACTEENVVIYPGDNQPSEETPDKPGDNDNNDNNDQEDVTQGEDMTEDPEEVTPPENNTEPDMPRTWQR